MTFKVVISSQLRCLESSFSVWHLEPPFLLSFGFQSHHFFINLAFRATSSFWCSEPLFVFSSTFRAIMSFFYLMFRVTSSVLHLEPCFQFGVQSYDFSMTFEVASPIWRSKPHLLFGIQSHYLLLTFRAFIFFSLAFRVVSSFWHSESLFSLAFNATIFFLVLAFRVVMHTHSSIQSYHLPSF